MFLIIRSKVLIFGLLAILALSCNERQRPEDKPLRRKTLTKAAGGRYYGRTFKVREIGNFRSFDPHNIATLLGARIVNQIFEGLVKLNHDNLSVEPNLAKTWTIDSTGTIYTFYLRNGVYFQQDKSFGKNKTRIVTAYDVEYCLTRLCEFRDDNELFLIVEGLIKGASEYYKSTKQGNPLSEKVSGIKIINDSIVQIELNAPSDQFLFALSTCAGYIFPKEAVEFYGKNFANSPIGTGPFYLANYVPEEEVLLKKNPNYWGKDTFKNQLPFLDGIEISFSPKKLDEIMDFRKNKLDILYQIPVQYINQLAGDIEAAKEGKNQPFKIQTTPKWVQNT